MSKYKEHLNGYKAVEWYDSVERSGFKAFQVIARAFFDNERVILNFFDSRSTYASAESFNRMIKNFRTQSRRVSDARQFLFRLQNIYAYNYSLTYEPGIIPLLHRF